MEPKHKPIMIQVQIFDQTDNLIRDHKKDLTDKQVRAWMLDMMMWAVKHGYTVEINQC
jgi:hypothetical protein